MKPIFLLLLLVISLYHDVKAIKQECFLPSYEGQYMSLHIFWYYSPTLGRCVRRTYGGPAVPGLNHFDSLEDCQQTCMD